MFVQSSADEKEEYNVPHSFVAQVLDIYKVLQFYQIEQGKYSLRRPPKLIIPQAVIRHWEKMSFCMHIDV